MITKITVPQNGNDMFWSVMLAYLEPVKTDENELKKRCQKIFNNTKYWKDILEYFNIINKSDNADKNKEEKYFFTEKKFLVSLFRQNIVEYMKKNMNDIDKELIIAFLRDFYEQNKAFGYKPVSPIAEYCELMKTDGVYGNAFTLKMISKFINHRIIVRDVYNKIEDFSPEFKEKIYLNYSNVTKHYGYLQDKFDGHSGCDWSAEISKKCKQNNDNFYSMIKNKLAPTIARISELEYDKDSSSNKLEELYKLYIDTQGLAEYSLKLIDKNGIENIDKKIKMVDFVNAKIDYLLKCIEDLSIKPNSLNSEIKTEQEKLEVEAKTLECQNSKSDIESKIKIQENLKKFLTEEHATNVGKIKEINETRENNIKQRINELCLKINRLEMNIDKRRKIISRLNQEVSSIDEVIKSKRKDIQKITEKIKNIEKKKRSLFSSYIAILTFGICYRSKSFQRKIDKIKEKKIIIEEEIKKLLKIKLQKMEKHKILYYKKAKNVKKVSIYKADKQKLEEQLNDNNSSSEVKITELQIKNDKINLELDRVNKQIYELKCNLIRTSCGIRTKDHSFEKNKLNINNENPITNINVERRNFLNSTCTA